MHNRIVGAALVAAVTSTILAAGGPMAFAQAAIAPPKLPGNQPQVPVLKLTAHREVTTGTVAAIKGTVDGQGLRFAVGSLSILQPVVITLLARDPADDLKLTLFKKDWKEPRRAGSTGTRGLVAFDFRTEGGVNILVQSSGPPQAFALVAWAGEEIRPSSMKDVIVTPAQFKGSARAAGAEATSTGEHGTVPAVATSALHASRLGWFVAAGLGVAVLMLAAAALRRTRK